MPRGDRTGPAGLGPMTGRGAGFCAGYSVPGYLNPIPGRGFLGRGFYGQGFWGRGGGRGWRNRFYATGLPGWAMAPYPFFSGQAYPSDPEINTNKEDAGFLKFLKDQAELLKRELENVQSRINDMEKEQTQSGE